MITFSYKKIINFVLTLLFIVMLQQQNGMTGGGGATGRGTGTARERAMQAVEYYNSTVLRARVGAGLLACSHNHHAQQRSPPSVQVRVS